jgi:hypothetical protein
MKKQHLNSNGFSTVELLLVIVTLAIIGVAGYFVAKHVDKKTPAPVAATTASTSTKPVTTTKTTASTSAASTTSDTTTSGCRSDYITVSGQKSLIIQQWGIQIPLSSTISDLCYVWTPANSSTSTSAVATIESSSLYNYASQQDSACSINNTVGADNGTIPFYQIGQITEAVGKTGTPPASADEDLGAYVSLSGNEYLYYTPQDGCSSLQSVSNAVSGYITSFEAELPKSQLVN